MPQSLITKISSKIIGLKLYSNLQGANELTHCGLVTPYGVKYTNRPGANELILLKTSFCCLRPVTKSMTPRSTVIVSHISNACFWQPLSIYIWDPVTRSSFCLLFVVHCCMTPSSTMTYKVGIWNNTWHFITMTSWWARWRLKSPASRLFTQ